MLLKDAVLELNKINSLPNLPKAIKNHYSALQSVLDSTTASLYDYLKPGLLTHLTENIFYSSKEINVLCGVLIPSITITANDIAPDYNLQIKILWHLNLVTQGTSSLKHISGLMVFSNDAFSTILDQVIAKGLNITTNIPEPNKCSLVLEYIEKQKMIERFSVFKDADS